MRATDNLLPAIARGAVCAAGSLAGGQGMLARGVRRKSHGNFVTGDDERVEAYLRGLLGELLPEAGFVGEESAPSTGSSYRWIVDPIDGTGNYLSGFDYAISIALESGEGAELGVVYAPHGDRLFFATRSGGAYVLEAASTTFVGDRPLIDLDGLCRASKTIRVTPASDDEGIIIFGMPYDRDKTHRILGIVEALYPLASDAKRIGPASLDICRVACSMAKLYVELDLKPWDYAAGALVLEEAGGTVASKGDLMLFGDASAVAQAEQALLRRGLV